MPAREDSRTPPTVYVSYTRDSAAHERKVHQLARFLRTEAGVDAELDLWAFDQRRDLAAWVIERIRDSRFVLAIASPQYRHVLDGGTESGTGRSRLLESALIRDDMSRSPQEATGKILPVVLAGSSREDVPRCLLPYSAHCFTVPAIDEEGTLELRRALYGVARTVRPRLGGYRPPAPPPDLVSGACRHPGGGTGPLLAAGAEIELGRRVCLVEESHWGEHVNAERSAVRRRARALELTPPRGHLWLRQVEVRHRTPAAEAVLLALRREQELLGLVAGKAPALPGRGELLGAGTISTLVTPWPPAGKRDRPADTLAAHVPVPGEPAELWRVHRLMRELAKVCQALSELHEHNVTHRALAPGGIVRRDDGRLALLDLGLAAVEPEPGEGPEGHRAPEQSARRRHPTGPWTDVYQIAALVRHLATGHPPAPGPRVPLASRLPGLAPAVGAMLDAALDVDTTVRPTMTELGAMLADAA